MAETTLRLITKPDGSQQLVVDHKSDPSALAHEHEEEHREIVDSLVEKGGATTKTRDNDGTRKAPAKPHEVQEREKVGNGA